MRPPRCEQRPFAAGDLDRLLEWLEDAGLGVRPRLPEHLLVRRLVSDPGIVSRVVTQDGAMAGFYRLDLAPDRTAELTLLVDPLRLRRGIGTRIVELALQESRRRGVRALVAIVQQDNLRAQRFFEALGFEPISNHVPGFVHLERLIHRTDAAAPLEIQP